MLKLWQKIAAVGLLAIVIAPFAISFLFPADYQICAPNEYTHAKECSQYYLGQFVILWIVRVLDAHNGLVTAIATAFVAGFTWTLWRTSERQGDLAQQSIDLARAEFISTHRPKIIVYGMNFIAKTDELIAVSFRYVNAGESDATIVDVGTKLVHLFKPTMSSTVGFDSKEMGLKVPSGMHGFFITDDTVNADARRLLNALMSKEKLVCVGYIVYKDDNGTRRQMGFCREYDASSSRWRAMKDDDYEYSY